MLLCCVVVCVVLVLNIVLSVFSLKPLNPKHSSGLSGLLRAFRG